jgi:CBS domain-containing protein/anti-sigma regulatory factor (Ser/Thr protein kinase)
MKGEEVTKVQELMLTTPVELVMAKDVIKAHQDLTMAEVQSLMCSRRILVVPVVEGDDLVGMVTMFEVLAAMQTGRMADRVSSHMTTDVKSVFKDAPVAEVVNGLGRRGFTGLPVVDREGRLIGIVTTGTLIRALIAQMDRSFKKKEGEIVHTYRASHIFEDIVSDDTRLQLRYVVDEKDFTNAGKASSMIKRSLQRLGAKPAFVRRIAVAVYEAEMNLVIHTDVGGEINVEIRRDRVLISTVDHGPGIDDIQQVLQPGFSTAPQWIRDMGFGAGMGLANIKRCSDTMRLMSEPGSGTRLDMVFLFRDSPMGTAGT